MKELYKALFEASKELHAVPRDAQGNFGTYTTLESLIDYTKPLLARHGLFILQRFINDSISTMIVHPDSGQTLESTYKLVAEKQTPQSYGAAITYARRYAILALLGIASGDDPDAHTQQATHRSVSTAPRATSSKSMGLPVNDAANFIITWGKYKDKRLGQLSREEVWGYVEFLEKKARDEGKPAGKNVDLLKEALNALETGFAEAPPIGAYKDDEVPF